MVSDQSNHLRTAHNFTGTHSSKKSSVYPFRNITVIGGGAWGTALALTAERAGAKTTLWIREDHAIRSIHATRENPFLIGISLPNAISVTSDLQQALQHTDCVVFVVPSQFLRVTARSCQQFLKPGVPVVICSKGIEAESGKLMTQIVAEEMPGRPQAVLSGPSFAREVALGYPTAVTVATECRTSSDLLNPENIAVRVALSLTTTHFRPYVSDDPVGVEVGGAVKNVIAIACGMAAGLGLKSNSRSALMTRGLAEMNRLAIALGGRSETVSGLAGMGDLALTCSDEQSRNFSFGKNLAAQTLSSQEDSKNAPVVEGVWNAQSVVDLANRLDIEMPICNMVYSVIHRGLSVEKAMQDLMTRPIRAEVRAMESFVRIAHPEAQETKRSSASR